MKHLLKNGREKLQLKTVDVARLLEIDTALISKFESGGRMPTHPQILKLAELLKLDPKELETAWLTEKILLLVNESDVAIDALQASLKKLGVENSSEELSTPSIQKLMAEMETLKSILTAPKK